MPINNQSLNKELYKLFKVRGFDPIPKDSTGETSPVPDEADVFKFTFKQDGKAMGTAWATVDGDNNLTVYYGDDVTQNVSEDERMNDSFDLSWTGFLKHLKMWAQRKQMGFDLENKDHLHSDMAQREYTKKQESMRESRKINKKLIQGNDMNQVNEGYYPMGKAASYNDAIPTVKIILQHTRQIQEGEQRYRNIARIFLENTQGERFLAPTNKPGIAQIYARHLAEGGVPNDERWNHIKSLCEEYMKMSGFVRAVRNNQFNESAQKLINEGINHYQNLRESLSKMRGHRGYNAYFESWTPTLMENEGEENTLNELFVQETLDPRIESVMPILNKLSKNISEVKEVKELEEWADKLTEAPGAETLAHNQATASSNLKAFDLEEDMMNEGWFADTLRNVGKAVLDRLAPNDKQLLIKLQQDMGIPTTAQHGKPSMARTMSDEEVQKLIAAARKVNAGRNSNVLEDEIEESGLQAYLGNKKYGKEGMDALRKAGRDGASKEKMAKIRAKVDENQSPPLTLSQLYDPNLRPSPFPYQDPISKRIKQLGLDDKEYADLVYKVGDILARQTRVPNPYADSRKWSPGQAGTTIAKLDPRPTKEELKQAISTGKLSTRLASATALEYERQTGRPWVPEFTQGVAEGQGSLIPGKFYVVGKAYGRLKSVAGPFDDEGEAEIEKAEYSGGGNRDAAVAQWTGRGWNFDYTDGEQGVAENLDANQKRVGQLGPTEKVGPKGAVGKLVGANESIEQDPLLDLKRLMGK